jgi:hypothetical protein
VSNKVMFKKDREEKWLPLDRLGVNYAEAQRPLNVRFADEIAENFDPYKFGRIQVAQVNGRYHSVDGQTRCAAVRKLWGDTEMVPCDVIPAASPAEAAELFLGINDDRRPMQAIDRFRVSVTAERADFVAVNALLTGLGYTVGMSNEDGYFAAVGAAMTVYRRHGEDVLKDALLIIQATWGMDRDSVHTALVQGYAEMVAAYGPVMDRKRLANRVAKELTPGALLGRAKAISEMVRCTRPKGVMRALVAVYNHGLRTEIRLEEPGY